MIGLRSMCLLEHVFECSVIVVGVRRRDCVGEERRRVQELHVGLDWGPVEVVRLRLITCGEGELVGGVHKVYHELQELEEEDKGREEVQEIERESQVEEKRSRGHDYGDDMKGLKHLEPQCVCGWCDADETKKRKRLCALRSCGCQWKWCTHRAVPRNHWCCHGPIILLQHGYCTFVIILFGPFRRLCVNLTVWIRALFSKPATTLGLVEQASRRVPLFTEWIGASSFEVIVAWQSKHSAAGTFASGTSGSRCTLILPRRRARRRIRLCHFCTFIDIVTETAIVSFRTLPVGFARWLSTASNLLEFFVHAVLSPDSWPPCSFHNFRFWLQNSWFVDSARYICLPLSSICDNQVRLSSDESPVHAIPMRSWVSQTLVLLICTILPRCHQVGFSS